MSACLRRQLLGPHVGDGTLPQPLLANAHFHHDGHQCIEICGSDSPDVVVTLALDLLPSHEALGLERGGLDVPHQLVCTNVATMQPDGVGKGGIHQPGADLHPLQGQL